MNTKAITVAAIALTLATAAVFGQTTLKLPGQLQPVRPQDTNSPTERIAALETQVAQLTAKVNSLSAKLDQTSKSAFDANFKAGLVQVWVNANGDGAVKTTQWVNSNSGPIMAVVTAYPKHTHTYQYPSLGYTNVGCDPGQGGYCSYISKWTSYDQTTGSPK
jgi:hypothetical protein